VRAHERTARAFELAARADQLESGRDSGRERLAPDHLFWRRTTDPVTDVGPAEL
jgi:hypothetical protein